MEARKKKGPILPKWTALKNRQKALKEGDSYTPDIMPAINKHDQALKSYDALVAELEGVKDHVKSFLRFHDLRYKNDSSVAEDFAQAAKKKTTAMEKDTEKLRKFVSGKDLDPDGISDLFKKLHSAEVDRAADRKKTLDVMRTNDDTTVSEALAGSQNIERESKAVLGKVKKLEKEVRGYNVDVIMILDQYVKIAEKANERDVAKALEGLISDLGR
jgi:hypothetical protein